MVLSGYYTREDWEANQSARTIYSDNPAMAYDEEQDWWADTEDEVETYNIHLGVDDLGETERFALGFDYTVSNVESLVDVQGAEKVDTLPLPPSIGRSLYSPTAPVATRHTGPDDRSAQCLDCWLR